MNSSVNALNVSGFGADKQGHGFAPHISLVRKVPDAGVVADVVKFPPVEPVRWHCDRFVLVCSRRAGSPPYSYYEEVAEFPLILSAGLAAASVSLLPGEL